MTQPVVTLTSFTLRKEEIFSFAREHDPYPFHLDEQVANASILGGLAASGWQTTTEIVRQLSSLLSETLPDVRSLGVTDLNWLRPVYVNQPIEGTAVLSGLGTALIEARVTLVDGEEHPVLSGTFSFKVGQEGAGS